MEKPKADVGSLESSLLQIIEEHNQTYIRIRDQSGFGLGGLKGESHWTVLKGMGMKERHGVLADNAKKDALRTAVRVSDLLVDTVNSGVEESFINEKRIELEIRTLVSIIMRYTKQTNQWLAASHSLNSAIKEIGDFENWMKTMEYDCKSINAALRNIHQ